MAESASENFVRQLLDFASSSGFDSSRDMGEVPLRYLEYYLTRHFPEHAMLRTIEFGCGISTAVFARYAHEHTVCAPKSQIVGYKKSFEDTPFEKKFIAHYEDDILDPEGQAISGGFDVVLLNHNKAYPVAEIHFAQIIPHVKDGAIFVVSGTDVPTIRNFVEFLKQDDLFYAHSVVQDTVFLVRTTVPCFDFKTRDWQDQNYNSQTYLQPSWQEFRVRPSLPVDVVYDGHLKEIGDWFARGFTLFKGRPVTDGWYSSLTVPFETEVSGTLQVRMRIEVIAPDEREGAGVVVDVAGACLADVMFEDRAEREISFTVEMDARRQLTIGLTHRGVVRAGQIPALAASVMLGARRPNFVIRSLSIRQAGSQEPARNLRRADGSIVSFDYRNQTFRFFVENPYDSIQGHHSVGEFYEIEELELLTRTVPRGARILDIGANIGNHSVWFEKLLGARSIMPVEPQARMVALYRTNCQLNGLSTIDERCLGLALGDVNQTGDVQIDQAFNPAGARIEPSAGGAIQIRIGDEVLPRENFDFVKIDVEGAELSVLRGLRALFRRCRPLLFVEVWDGNRADFDALMAEFDYEIVEEYRRYDIATNLLLRSRKAGTLSKALEHLRQGAARTLHGSER